MSTLFKHFSYSNIIIATLVQTAHGAAASKIKGLDNNYIAHKVAHAMAGCAAAAANKGKCQDGAIGAAVGEIVGEKLLNGRNVKNLNPEEYKQILAYSRLVAGTAAGLAGGDVNAAADAAKVAVENNALYPKCIGSRCDEIQKDQQDWINKNPKEYAEYVITATGVVLPIVGAIDSIRQADTVADYLFALSDFIPGLKTGKQAYQTAKVANDLSGMKKILDGVMASATQHGYINQTKYNMAKTELSVRSQKDLQLLNQVQKGQDKTGKVTEQLFDSLAKQNNFAVIRGGKYGNNNGFDHVWVAKDGSVVILSESKQIKNGTIQLNAKAAGGHTQMSDAWVDMVVDKLPMNDPARAAVREARRNGKLKLAITGVDRQTGKAVILPIQVPAKNKLQR
ncbi:VENN motif pre-toxin domain-containing protein [Uruburuella testudinis]|uniref:VENN motif pre-toxin domain-containing protein n=1 Tax=Uruburuella testudinis TaxID=1282863 RepID=A0ABY4DTV4_9NEIS|nr:VENN motif pre-toxin domain-containing protein [Uruburuella testudinis]UOO82471.1 VENN motif pre-toxin domain-containing protein [Uruburuella testudinis]